MKQPFDGTNVKLIPEINSSRTVKRENDAKKEVLVGINKFVLYKDQYLLKAETMIFLLVIFVSFVTLLG